MGDNCALKAGVVPVIDLSGLVDGKMETKTELGRQLNKASEDIGFFALKGYEHIVPQAVIDAAWAAAWEFFDLPVEKKEVCLMTDAYPFGYMGMEKEQLSAGLGEHRPPDLKESFQIGPEDAQCKAPPRQWPAEPATMKAAWSEYYTAVAELGKTVMRLLALGLGLDEAWFDDKMDHHMSALRALNYPVNAVAPLPDQFRASEHTDYGALTFLKSGGPGLQVKTKSGEWMDIAADPNMYVVNLGDLMPYWTNNRYVSTMHRVVYIEGDHAQRRQSMPLFFNMNEDALIECIPTCHSEQVPKKFPPITAGEHLMAKHKAASMK